MKKQQRKEISDSLYQLIDAHLSTHNAKAANKVQKLIRSASKSLAKKFAKAVKQSTAKVRTGKASQKNKAGTSAKTTSKK